LWGIFCAPYNNLKTIGVLDSPILGKVINEVFSTSTTSTGLDEPVWWYIRIVVDDTRQIRMPLGDGIITCSFIFEYCIPDTNPKGILSVDKLMLS
jgi:hypothetical protein